jgi:hypothetical protein
MAAQQDFWGQFEVVEYDKPQYDWGQFEQVPQNKDALETSLNELPENDPYVKTQKHQTEQLANMLFTKEELEKIKNKGEIGWVEYRNRGFVGWSDILPFVGTAKEAGQAGKTLSIAKKLENGEEVSEADKAYMKQYLRDYVELQTRGMKWSAKGASMFLQAPAFMAEFALTGGLGEVAAKGAIKGASKGASKIAVKGATKTAARIAGQQAVLVPTYAIANYNERKLADGLNITDKGDMLFDSQKAEGNNKANALKALGTGEIQILSELSGGVLGKMAAGVGGVVGKGIGKVATTNVARGISATSAKVYNSLPKNVRIKLEASARVAENLGKKANQAGEQMKSKGLEFHGVAEEMGEERVEDILMTAFDLDSKEGYSADQWLDAIFPDPQQLMLEAGIFSIVGAGSFATRTVTNDLINKGYSDKEATTISQNLSEIEKENMANEILGEVKINEDIKEQEVIKEQVKIENAMLKGGISITENAQENTTETQKPKTLSDYKKDILSNKFEDKKLDTIKGSYKNSYYTKTLPTLNNDITEAERGFNKLINEIYKNPSLVDNTAEVERIEKELENITDRLPQEEELIYPYYEKFYNAINSANEYLEAKKKKSKAAELYDIEPTNFDGQKVKDKTNPLDYDYINFKDTNEKIKLELNPGLEKRGNEKVKPIEIAKTDVQFKSGKKTDIANAIKEKLFKYKNGKPTPIQATNKSTNTTVIINASTIDESTKELLNNIDKDFIGSILLNSKDIFENSELILTNTEAKNANLKGKQIVSRYALPLRYNGEDYIAISTVFDNKRNQVIKLYHITGYKNSDTNARNQNASGVDTTNISISDLTNFVKSRLVEKYNNDYKNLQNKNNELYDISDEAPKKTEAPKILKEVEEIADKEAEKAEENKGIKGLYSDFKQAFSEFIEPLYTEAVDRFAPIQNTVKRANKKGADLGVEITDKNWTENPYNLARMYSGLANRIWQHFKENTTQRAEDGTQKITGEGFGKIIEDLYKETKDIESNKETQLKDFEDYLIAKRFLLDLKDREGYEATEEQKLKAIQDMARLAEKYGEEMTTLEKLADRVYEYNRRTLHLLVDSGNMSQETYDKIIEQNPHHISYKRVMDENYGTNGLSFAKGKFTDAKSPIKKIRGSEKEIQSIYKSTLEDTMRIIDVAERNLIARKTAELQKYLPEEIKPIKPLMDKVTAKVKVAYDAKMRSQLEEAIKFFGRTFKNVKSVKTPSGYALGSYSEEEKEVRKKLGSQDRTLAHEVGHMLDFALDVENQIKNDSKIMQEIKTLAEDRFKSTVKLQDGEFITEDAGSTEKYKNYVQSNKEAIANAFDLYFTSRDYVKRVAPETAKFINNLFKGEYAFLNEIRPSSETATEEILQDVWAPSKRKPSNNSIGYYEDGKLKFVEVPTNLMKSIEDLNPKQYGMIAQAVDKLFKGSSDILRAGATLNPEFILRNPIRDVQEAWFNIEGFNPLIDVPKGLMSVIGKKNSKLYKEWQREGGAFNSYMELNEKTINEAIKLYEDKKPLIWKTLGFVPSTLEKLSSTLEESTRLGIYNAMLRKGLTPTQAAFMSREGTLDFARGGRFTKQANRYLTFLNAGVQGTDRVLRTIATNPKQALKVGMTMAMGQILLSGYYLYLAPDDDRQEYLEIPEYVKNVSYVFKVGDKWWKIPRPFAPGYIFEAIPEKFITWLATNEKPEGLKLFNFAKDLFTSASPITDPSDFIPVLPKIWIENTANYNFFTERQIYPDYLNQYSPKERYNKNTSETAKLLGEKLDMSPALIENAIRGQFGNAGKYALDVGDAMQDGIKKLLGEEVNERPKDISNVWGVRGFAVKDPIGNQSNSVNTFNKNFKELSETHNDYNKLQKESKQEAREFKEEHKEELRQYKSASESNKKIKELRKDINKILKDTKLSGEEKAEKIKTKEERMTEIARKANEKLKE